MVHSHENIKLSNKEEILNKINEKTNIPMSEEILKHNLVEKGVSSYQFKLQGSDAFKPIIETFKKLSKGNYEVVDFWFNGNDTHMDGTPDMAATLPPVDDGNPKFCDNCGDQIDYDNF